MEKNKESKMDHGRAFKNNFIEHLWEKSWAYIKTVVDVMTEPILILDKDLRVMAANEAFYKTFKVEAKDTENKIVYELGNGQWDIPALKNLLKDIIPKNTYFKGFNVNHEFPLIGRKIIILNARQLHSKEKIDLKTISPMILLAMEDVTEMMTVAEIFASHTNEIKFKLDQRTKALESHTQKLQKAMDELKNRTV